MRKSILLTTVLAIFAVAFMSGAQAGILPTNLRFTVIDESGNVVKGASVTLYENEKDYLNEKNPIAMLKTDAKGRVTFKKLSPKAYYIMAKKGDKTNEGGGEKTFKLVSGRLNKINIVIQES
ncbi:hypothetical protein FUAX_11920 [Fulvitalea axinellae]|uniref:SpaA-like prealbumin fold domain-containing protein n=1 Tax=Fulvitalea axinellae TaxID=1182444 RepID=A0AAU9D907_9BACT|nr:hypothetical protein FUAX_11920 [Fulvitalea axinellae]